MTADNREMPLDVDEEDLIVFPDDCRAALFMWAGHNSDLEEWRFVTEETVILECPHGFQAIMNRDE